MAVVTENMVAGTSAKVFIQVCVVAVCCSVLQCEGYIVAGTSAKVFIQVCVVAVRSVLLQCIATWCSVLQCVYIVLQYDAVCCSVEGTWLLVLLPKPSYRCVLLQSAVCCSRVWQHGALCCSMMQVFRQLCLVAVCCSVFLKCFEICCTVLQC